jgi:hypothetical protein
MYIYLKQLNIKNIHKIVITYRFNFRDFLKLNSFILKPFKNYKVFDDLEKIYIQLTNYEEVSRS